MSKSRVLFWKVIRKTPKALSVKWMERYEHYLSAKLPTLDEQEKIVCQNRIELLRQEIQFQRKEKKDDQRHQKVFGVERVSVGIAIGAIVIAAAGLIYEIFFSKVLPATSEATLPTTYRQTPAPTIASQESESNPSSTTPSPKQSPTAQPS